MPIYEYVCRSCGKELEKLQKMSDAPLTECPGCGESALKRKVSAAGFRLAGSGWYETDFKSGNRHNIAGNNDAKAGKGGDSGKGAAGGTAAAASGNDGKAQPKTDSGGKGATAT